MFQVKLCILLGVIYLVSMCDGYRILGVFPLNGKSHQIVFEALMKGLAKRGHQVDMITHFTLDKPLKNYNVIINLSGRMKNLVNNMTIEYASKNSDVVTTIATRYGNNLCHFMGYKEMQQLIKHPPTDPPYDLVITEALGANCYIGLGYVLKVPVVTITSSMEFPWVTHLIGNNDNLAYASNMYHVGSVNMNFWQRLKNVVIYFNELRKFHSLTESQTDSMRKYLSPDIPSIREVERNVALALVNSHPLLYGVKPITPSLVHIAGIHIEDRNEVLPLELKRWMDDSSHGVVLFTFGSMVLIETFPKEKLEQFYDTFEKLAPIRILMKISDSSKLPPGLPKNVKVSSWIPQQAILAHPNTKIFITHGGLGGVQEALYYGVPMIGIPLFNDQQKNVELFVAKKMMIEINFHKLSGELLHSVLKTLIQNPIYKERSLYNSKLFRSRPISVMDNAIFWIEYVTQHGGDSLRSPALQFYWWQLALLDVYMFIGLIMVSSFIVILLSMKIIFRKVIGKSKNINSNTKKSR